jgi:GH25 family lysozyme M1 (1,4-beta-N-acetylmuramidase)
MAFSATDGIDVSHHNGELDWSYCQDRDRLRIRKAWGVRDGQFGRNYPAIAANGMLRGAYDFLHPGADPRLQAANFFEFDPTSGTRRTNFTWDSARSSSFRPEPCC